ncbi:MAG: ABC transporter permease, partial [Chloroflexota bacterium]
MTSPSATLNGETLSPLGGVEPASRKQRTVFGDAWRTLKKRPLAMFGLIWVLLWLFLGVFAPFLPINDPNYQDLSVKLQGPSGEHPFCTDELGRDMISRVFWGARV